MVKFKVLPYISVLVATVLLSFLYITTLSGQGVFIWARLKSIDSLYNWRANSSGPLPSFENVVIIGVDDGSYKKMDLAWPWGRNIFGDFINKLKVLEPKTIALDFSFVGTSTPEADGLFADAISKAGNVILAAYFDRSGNYVLPLGAFREAAVGYGFVDKPLDKDAVTRRSKVVLESQEEKGAPAYSLATQVSYHYFGRSPGRNIALTETEAIFAYPDRENQTASLNSNKEMWVSYRYRPEKFSYVPFWKVVAGEVPAKTIAGKLVLVGPVSSIFHDIHMTPLGLMAGVFVNANEVLTLLDADYIHELLPGHQWYFFLIVMIFSFVTVFYIYPYLTNLIVLGVAEAVLYTAAVIFFCRFNAILEPFSAMFIPALCYVTVFFQKSLNTLFENVALQKMVITDNLTGLYGQAYLKLRLEMEYKKNQRENTDFCFMMIDVDFFKKVNDTYGHEKGNEVLIAVAQILKQGVRGEDVVARYGGEEFSIIFSGQAEKEGLMVMERIRKTIEAHKFDPQNENLRLTVSAGICSNRNPHVRNPGDMVQLADKALYAAKQGGRNQTKISQ